MQSVDNLLRFKDNDTISKLTGISIASVKVLKEFLNKKSAKSTVRTPNSLEDIKRIEEKLFYMLEHDKENPEINELRYHYEKFNL